jgi:hypothetical protein
MGGGGSQTTTQTIDPMLKPHVEYGLGEARRLYEQGMPAYYPGQTFAGPSDYTNQAIGMAAERAQAGSPLVSSAQQATQQATGYQAPTAAFGDIYARSQMQPGAGMYGDIYGRAQQGAAPGLYTDIYGRAQAVPTAGMFSDIYGRAGQVSPDATAAGQYLGMNPFLQGTFQAAARPITQEFQKQIADVQSAASRAGRYGSGAQAALEGRAAESLASNLAGLGERLGFQGYQAERGLQEAALSRQQQAQQQAINQQIAAASGLGAAGQQALATQIAAAGGLGSTQAQQLAAQLQAAGGVTQAGFEALRTQLAAAQGLTGAEQGAAATRLQASQMAPMLAEQDYTSAQRLLQAGQTQEAYRQQAIDAAMQKYQYEQMSPFQALQSYLSSVYGAPSGSVTSRPYTGNPLLGTLGGAATGASLISSLGLGGYTIPAAVFGGLLGGFGSRS